MTTFLKMLSGYKRVILGISAMFLAAFGAVPPEWQGWALGATGFLTALTKAIDMLVPAEDA